MREIKFRGRVKNTNKPQWVYGIVIPPQYSSWEDWTLFDGERRWIVDPETVGQYTGLCDSEGKEVYEGDILEFDYRKRREKGCVHYSKYGIFVSNDVYLHDDGLIYVIRRNAKVIGNAIDNPELLKDGEDGED